MEIFILGAVAVVIIYYSIYIFLIFTIYDYFL